VHRLRTWLIHPMASFVIVIAWLLGAFLLYPATDSDPTIDIVLKVMMFVMISLGTPFAVYFCLLMKDAPFEQVFNFKNYFAWLVAARIIRWVAVLVAILWITQDVLNDFTFGLMAVIFFAAAVELRLGYLLQQPLAEMGRMS
jgi:hypothetical protein